MSLSKAIHYYSKGHMVNKIVLGNCKKDLSLLWKYTALYTRLKNTLFKGFLWYLISFDLNRRYTYVMIYFNYASIKRFALLMFFSGIPVV